MKKTFLSAVVAGLLLASTASFAADAVSAPSFDYVQAVAENADIKDANGWGTEVSVSKTLGETFFVAGGWERANLDVADRDQIRVGLGARFALAPNTTLYGEAFGLHENVDFNHYQDLKDVNKWGYGFEAGLRTNLTDAVELRGAVLTERETRLDTEWVTYGVVGGQINLSQNLAAVVDVKFHDSNDVIYQGGLRLSF